MASMQRRGATEGDPLLGDSGQVVVGATREPSEQPWWRTPSVYWLIGPFFLFSLAFGGILVPKLNLMLELVCRKHLADRAPTVQSVSTVQPWAALVGGDDPQCKAPDIQRRVATLSLFINLITGGLSAVVAPKIGHLSDGYGRLRLLALASCGGLLGELVTVLVAKFPDAIDYRWLLLGAVFDGMGGSFTTGSILSQSYTSDCTPPSGRSVSVGYIQACLFSGLALGPVIAGYFAKWTGSLLSVFYVVVVCHALLILFLGLVVPESVSKDNRLLVRQRWRKEKEARALGSAQQKWNPLAPLAILWPTGPGTSSRLRVNLLALAMCDATIMGGALAATAVVILYAEYTFNWGNLETSRFVSAMSLMRVMILMGIFPLVNYFGRVRPRRGRAATRDTNSGSDRLDGWLLSFALLCEVLGCLGYTLGRTESLFFGSGFVTAFGALGMATTQAALTKHVPAERVGQVLGAVGMLHALARVIGPVIFSGLYAATVATFPQAIFVALGAMYGIALIISFVVKPGVHWEGEHQGGTADAADVAVSGDQVCF